MAIYLLGYNQYYQQQQQQHSMLSTLPDYMATQQAYMASAFPVSQGKIGEGRIYWNS